MLLLRNRHFDRSRALVYSQSRETESNFTFRSLALGYEERKRPLTVYDFDFSKIQIFYQFLIFTTFTAVLSFTFGLKIERIKYWLFLAPSILDNVMARLLVIVCHSKFLVCGRNPMRCYHSKETTLAERLHCAIYLVCCLNVYVCG